VLPVEARDALARVARAVEVADYSPGGPTTTLAQDAAAAAHRVRTSLRENLSGRDRFVRLWDPRPVGALLFSRRA
jgi:hypothetical protein